jgi:multidrug efflux pump
LRESATARELGRFNKLRAITLQGSVAPGYALGPALALPRGRGARVARSARGRLSRREPRVQADRRIDLAGLRPTVFVIYLLLAAQFESFIHPAFIITAVPLAVAGGVFGLWLSGMTINLFSQIGVVMLVGLSAKNGVLIIEFANQLRDEGLAVDAAIREAAGAPAAADRDDLAGDVAGAVPLAMASGAGAGARSAIGVVVVVRRHAGDAVTLYVVPVLYRWLAPRDELAADDRAQVGGLVKRKGEGTAAHALTPAE